MKKVIEAVTLILALLSLSGEFAPARPAPQAGKATVSLSQPRKDGQLDCAPDAGAIFRCSVAGGVTGVSQGQRLLLWVRPVRPPSESEGWYLQRRPNGLVNQSGSTWDGKIQIGNRDFPPQDGDTVDVAVSITETPVADKLMKAPGVVIEPELIGEANTISDNIRLRIPRRR